MSSNARELTYEIESIDPHQAAMRERQIADLERELRCRERELAQARLERDLTLLRIRQFERMVMNFAGTVDQLQAEMEKLLRPKGKFA